MHRRSGFLRLAGWKLALREPAGYGNKYHWIPAGMKEILAGFPRV